VKCKKPGNELLDNNIRHRRWLVKFPVTTEYNRCKNKKFFYFIKSEAIVTVSLLALHSCRQDVSDSCSRLFFYFFKGYWFQV